MEKPAELIELLEELADEGLVHPVDAPTDARATIYLDEECEKPIALTQSECILIFQSRETVGQLIEALGSPETASLVLHNLELSTTVLDEVEKQFIAVDEDFD